MARGGARQYFDTDSEDVGMNRRVVISGCSGAGKSTLLAALRTRGFMVVEEPGRRIVREQLAAGGTALPWRDAAAFARRAMEVSVADLEGTPESRGWTFFDRGWVDAAAALQYISGEPALNRPEARCYYNQRVFLAPPWPEIYTTDSERRHGLEEAIGEYGRLVAAWSGLGYQIELLPKVDVGHRVDFVLTCLDRHGTPA